MKNDEMMLLIRNGIDYMGMIFSHNFSIQFNFNCIKYLRKVLTNCKL